MEEKTIAEYAYDKTGRLRAEWDPRLSPALKTTYGYDAEGHIIALTPPGLQPWTFTYGSVQGDSGTGRLLKATRAQPPAGISEEEVAKKLDEESESESNTEAPKITGSPVVGVRLAVSNGKWSGSPITYGYQWKDCSAAGTECQPIAGAVNPNYTLTSSDAGHTVVAEVTATNEAEAASAVSAATASVRWSETTEYSLPAGGEPFGMAAGPDGNVWFTDTGTGKAGKITTSGTVTEYSAENDEPEGITAGPDKNLWFVEHSVRHVNHITTSGSLTVFTLTRTSTGNVGIATGPDENLWFTESETGYVGKINTKDEVLGEYALPAGSKPYGIVAEQAKVQGKTQGKNLWFTDYGTNKIGKITTSGIVTEYGLPSGSEPYGIATGPDGNLWFTDYGTNKIGKITTFGTVTEYALPAGSGPRGITAGPEKSLWFTEYGTSNIGKISTSGTITEYKLSSGSEPLGIAVGSDNNIWFTEYGTNKIGKLSVGPPAEGESKPPAPGSTIDYNIPISGSGSPHEMSEKEVAAWGQKDDPVEGTAIFPQDEAQSWPASGFRRATVYYLDEEGRTVNIATPSTGPYGAIATTEYNETNNIVRTLTPNNRATALAAGEKSVEVSRLLDTENTYNGEGAKEGEVAEPGTRLIETVGPQHEVKYLAGKEPREALARNHEKLFYEDETAEKEMHEKYDLVTRTTDFAQLANEEEVEARHTTTSYSGQGNLGWALRAPTSVTEDPEGAKITHTTLYNSTTGQVIETRDPEGFSGESAHDSRTVYYSSEENKEGYAACGKHPEWAGLVCQTLPAKQTKTTGVPKLPVTTTTYNMWNEPEKVEEVFGSVTRATVNTYDTAGRLTAGETTSTSDTPLPKVTNEYKSTTGALEKQSTTVEGKTKNVTSATNTLGQVVTYTDADGNIAKFKHGGPETGDLLEEMSDSSNGSTSKQTYLYDPTTKLLIKLVDSAAGTFTATYDAEGRLASEVYPNSMCANYTDNSVGETTHIEYIKTGNCAEGKPTVWYSETRLPSVRGEVMSRASTFASQQYTYDTLGRLTETQETPTGEGCVVRVYAYDEESNRTSSTKRSPGGKGECATEGGTVEKHTYDEANRLTDTGITYDAFGNITSLPSNDAEEHTLETTFYVDNAVASQTQNKVTHNYYLDPTGRVRETVTGGKGLISHYDNPGEAVAWASEGSGETERWSRNIPGIDGTLSATQKGEGKTGEPAVLQLHDLEGNIVATAAVSPSETKLLSTYSSTEFGVPNGGKAPPPYAWMGAGNVASTLASGVITEGATSYVPQVGRALQGEEIAPPGLPDGSGGGAAVSLQEEPWNMQGATRVGAEAPGLEAGREREAAEAACKADPESCGTDPYYANILGARELMEFAAGYRAIAADAALLAAIIELAPEGAADYIGTVPATYATFLLQWAIRFEAVANSLVNRKPKDAIAFLVRKWTWHVHISKFHIHIDIELPYQFDTAYCWYKGMTSQNYEKFWCGKEEGWWYL